MFDHDEQVRLICEGVRIGVKVERDANRAMRQKLDKRIHMQRRSLAQIHGFLEQHGEYRPMAKEVRTKMVKSWSAALQERNQALRSRAGAKRIMMIPLGRASG